MLKSHREINKILGPFLQEIKNLIKTWKPALSLKLFDPPLPCPAD